MDSCFSRVSHSAVIANISASDISSSSSARARSGDSLCSGIAVWTHVLIRTSVFGSSSRVTLATYITSISSSRIQTSASTGTITTHRVLQRKNRMRTEQKPILYVPSIHHMSFIFRPQDTIIYHWLGFLFIWSAALKPQKPKHNCILYYTRQFPTETLIYVHCAGG